MKVVLVSLLIAFSVVLAQEPAEPAAAAETAVDPAAPEVLPANAPAPVDVPLADEPPKAAESAPEAQSEAEALPLVNTSGAGSLKGAVSLIVLPLGAYILSFVGY